jgi:hypothetical protein
VLEKTRQLLSTAISPNPLEALALEKKKQEWATYVNREYLKCKNARQPFENQWYINLAFANGKHYLSPINVTTAGMRLIAQKSPPWRVKLTINKTRTAIIKECAKLTMSRPIPTVVPATSEDEDYAAAKVAEHLLQNAFNNGEFETTRKDWVWWGVVCGVSFLKTYWDPNSPDDDLNQPSQNNKPATGMGGQPLMGSNGEPIVPSRGPVMGKIQTERITPFHIYVPDLLSMELEKQPYLIHVMTRSKLWVEEAFKPAFKVTEDVRATNTIMESATLLTKGSENVLDSVLVKEMWIKKNTHKDFPEGGLITVVNNQVVQVSRKWPCPFPEFPFYKFDRMLNGSFYSDSVVVDLIPVQKEYNRTRSQIIEIKNTIGKPKLVYQKGSLNPKQISTEPGQAIPYLAGFQPPVALPGAEVPTTMLAEIQTLSQEFDDITSQHEISRGDTPNNAVSSGTAISFLQEQDDTALNHPIGSIEYAMEMMGKHRLKYILKYWSEERTIRITGKDETFETKSWRGSDLRGNTDVKVQAGSALPFSKAARSAMVTEWIQLGLVDPIDGMEAMEVGYLQNVIDEQRIDKKQAMRENLIMSKMELDPEILQSLVPPEGHTIDKATGQPIDLNGEPWSPQSPFPVNSWDNHEEHIKYHNNFRKTQEFYLLDDIKKEIFELHVQTHQMALSNPQRGTMGMVANQPDPAMEQQMAEQQQAAAQQEQEATGQAQELDAKAQSSQQQLAQSDELHQADLSAKEQKQQQEAEAHQLKMQTEIRKASLEEAAKINKIRESGKKPDSE